MNIKILSITLAIWGSACLAAETDYSLTIKDHRFEPASIKVPSGQKIKLLIKNQDATPEEFESHDLNREKIIPAGKEVVVHIGPLKPGSYNFFGEFNPKTAIGQIIVE